MEKGESALPSLLRPYLPSLGYRHNWPEDFLRRHMELLSAAQQTSQPHRGGAPKAEERPRGRAAQGSGPTGGAQPRCRRPGSAQGPPRPLRLRSAPADGAPGANFAGKRKRRSELTGWTDDQRAVCVSASQQGRLTCPTLSPGGSSHLRREPGRPRGRRDGRYGTRPAFRRRVALQREAGRARRGGRLSQAGNSLPA